MNQICNFIIYDMHAKSCEFYTLNAAPFSANTSKNTDSDGQKLYETYHLCQGLSLHLSSLLMYSKKSQIISRLETPLAKNVGKPRSTQAFTFHVGDSPWYKHAWRW